jgi:hypothetical protein
MSQAHTRLKALGLTWWLLLFDSGLGLRGSLIAKELLLERSGGIDVGGGDELLLACFLDDSLGWRFGLKVTKLAQVAANNNLTCEIGRFTSKCLVRFPSF